MNLKTRPRKPLSAYGSERAALVLHYAAKLAAVAMLPRYMQAAARSAIRAEEQAALRALRAKAMAARAVAKRGQGVAFRPAALDVTTPPHFPLRRVCGRRRGREKRLVG